METWRLILDGSYDAAHNMAVDEAMLISSIAGGMPPTLRMYGWSTPVISLGYSQDIEHSRLDAEYCNASGIKIVRRPTGGRAVLHGHDITFSIALEQRRLPRESRSIRESHRWLMSGIARGLRILGHAAEIGPSQHEANDTSSVNCFASIAQCDIRVGNVKVTGAAQVRRDGSLLEQGSIPHTRSIVDLLDILGQRYPASPCLLEDHDKSAVMSAIVRGFGDALGIEFSEGCLTPQELSLAEELKDAKYRSSDWTFCRRRADIDITI